LTMWSSRPKARPACQPKPRKPDTFVAGNRPRQIFADKCLPLRACRFQSYFINASSDLASGQLSIFSLVDQPRVRLRESEFLSLCRFTEFVSLLIERHQLREKNSGFPTDGQGNGTIERANDCAAVSSVNGAFLVHFVDDRKTRQRNSLAYCQVFFRLHF